MTSIDDRPISFGMTLFGPMQVVCDGQPIPHLRSRKTLWLLALLALKGQRGVERQWLAGTLWPDVDSSQALANLRPALSEVRRALSSQAGRVRGDGRLTVSLDVDDAEIDLLTFDRLIDGERLSGVEEAVKLYRGALLEGCTEDWVLQERDAREQACLRGLQKLAEHALASGDPQAAIGFCRKAIGIDPLGDSAQRCLMEALERSGNRNAALLAYQEFSDRLRTEVGISPSEMTTEVYVRLRKAHRQRLQIDRPDTEAKGTDPVVSGYVPHPVTVLIGREDERLEVATRLRRSRLVTLIGPGGMGKTRLAMEVAEEAVRDASTYPDGVWLVALESLTDDLQLSAQLAATLNLTEEPGRPIFQTITDCLREKRLLLVLDNCEHLIEASAKIVDALLRECAGLRVLTTSREALGITGEMAWTVPALTTPDLAYLPTTPSVLVRILAEYESVQLFIDRAQAVQESFGLDEETALAIAQICSRLDGLPLAIELAAVQIGAMPVDQISVHLEESLGLVSNGQAAGCSRQATLRASLDWSHSLLSHAEQTLLRRLSVFTGGWNVIAAETICAAEDLPGKEILNTLTSLVDKSLAVLENQVTDSQTAARFHLLESVRHYAAWKLEESDEFARTRSRHRNFFLELAEEAEPRLTEADQDSWRVGMEGERANLLAALDWSHAETDGSDATLRLAGSLGKLWELHGHYSEGRRLLAKALRREGADRRTLARAKTLTAAGILAYHQGDTEQSKALHEEGLAINRELGNREGAAWSLNDLADIASVQGEDSVAERLYEQSLAIFREINDGNGIASLLHHLARVARDRGDYAQAKDLYEEGLEVQREVGNELGVGWALHHLGNLAYLQDDWLRAWALQEDSRNIFQSLGNLQGVAWTLGELSRVSLAQGNPVVARRFCDEALELFRGMGNLHGVGAILVQQGNLALKRGDLIEARRCYDESLDLRNAMGLRAGVTECMASLADLDLAEGQTVTHQYALDPSTSDRSPMTTGTLLCS